MDNASSVSGSVTDSCKPVEGGDANCANIVSSNCIYLGPESSFKNLGLPQSKKPACYTTRQNV